MNGKEVTLGCTMKMNYEYLEGYELTQEQLIWITELSMKDFLNTPLKERIQNIIQKEMDYAWEIHDADEADNPEWMEQLNARKEIDEFLDNE